MRFLSLIALAFALVGPAQGAVVFKGRAIDAATTIHQHRSSLPDIAEDLKVPFAGSEVTLELLTEDGSSSRQSWTVTTDGDGRFEVNTALERLPPGARFVLRATRGEEALFSPFYLHRTEVQSMHLYAPTTDARGLKAPPNAPCVEVAYGVTAESSPLLRVEVNVMILNIDNTMYVGRDRGGGFREICRVPLPEDAKIVGMSGPDPASPGWRKSEDGRWLIVDSPIPGVLDLDRQGLMAQKGWTVSYTVPGQQTFAQAYPVPMPLEAGQFAVWYLHKDMALEAPRLSRGPHPRKMKDPATGQERSFDLSVCDQPLTAAETVRTVLTVDNLPLRQVARGPAKWVGGFILVILLAVLVGLGLGAKGPAPEIIFRELSGDEILDRIADFDARFERGELREKDYRRYREALLRMASEEGLGGDAAKDSGPRTVDTSANGSSSPGDLPKDVRELLERIEAIDRAGKSDPATITERAHLLEALPKALQKRGE